MTDALLERLGERLVIERAAVELYALARARTAPAVGFSARLAEFQERAQERGDMLEKLIGELGGDPAERTPVSKLAGKEAEVLLEACRAKGASFRQILGAVVAVELMDSAGWDLLADLARDVELGQGWQDWLDSARDEERRHLGFVRRELERAEHSALATGAR